MPKKNRNGAASKPWTIRPGRGSVVAVALHDGHKMRPELGPLTALSGAERLREEDPHTGAWTRAASARVVVHRSRFELDLNRPRELCLYRLPEHAWGLKVWKEKLPLKVVSTTLDLYDQFYAEVRALLDEVARREGRFVVLDLHSYNHMRQGAMGPFAHQSGNPDINIGTGNMDRKMWAPLVGRVLDTIRGWEHLGRRLDARENISFHGGEFPRWVHRTYPGVGCALAIGVKKFYMNEWSDVLDPAQHRGLCQLMEAVARAAREELGEMKSQGQGAG